MHPRRSFLPYLYTYLKWKVILNHVGYLVFLFRVDRSIDIRKILNKRWYRFSSLNLLNVAKVWYYNAAHQATASFNNTIAEVNA